MSIGEHTVILQKPNWFALRIGLVWATGRRMAGCRRMLRLYKDGQSVSFCSPGTLLPLCITSVFLTLAYIYIWLSHIGAVSWSMLGWTAFWWKMTWTWGWGREEQLVPLLASRDQNSPAWGLMHHSFFGLAGALTDSSILMVLFLWPFVSTVRPPTSEWAGLHWYGSLNSCFSSLSCCSLAKQRLLCLFPARW